MLGNIEEATRMQLMVRNILKFDANKSTGCVFKRQTEFTQKSSFYFIQLYYLFLYSCI